MKKIQEIIRIHIQNPEFSNRQIARVLNISHPVVSQYLSDCNKSGLTSEELLCLNDDELINAIRGNKRNSNSRYKYIEERFEYYHQELKRRHVTLQILWEEYTQEEEKGYSYSQFSYHYQMWKNTLPTSMHMEHKAGDKLFIDYTGKRLDITDPVTGKITKVETYVGVLGSSQLTYFEAAKSQKKEEFIQSTVNCLRYMGGVPNALVPDCLKSGVTKSNKYEPVINPHFLAMAKYYHTTVMPARPLKPKDKALVEGAVKIVYQRVYAALRNSVFYSIEELNRALKEEMDKYNNRSMQKMKVSRRELYETVEKDALKPLPSQDYEVKRHSICKVQNNYHAYLSEDNHYYSVPYRFIHKEVEIQYTGRNVEIYHKQERIAFYPRDRRLNQYTTLKEHMPSSHQFVMYWRKEHFIEEGEKMGQSVANLCTRIMEQRPHPEQGFRACSGVLGLKKYGVDRLNKACSMSLESGVQSYHRVKWILDQKLDVSVKEQEQREISPDLPFNHENIRGKEYYSQELQV